MWETVSVLAFWVGAWVVFLCLHVFTAYWWVVGVGACFWVGHKSLKADKHTVGFTFNTV